MKQRIPCAFCNGTAQLQRAPQQLEYRKEKFTVTAHYYVCDSCAEEFTTTESDEITITQLHNQYREKHRIPFPEEIKAIREKYNLSAAKMSTILGLGINGYSNYENGEMPTNAVANLIQTADNPTIFETFAIKVEADFSSNSFKKLKEKIEELKLQQSIYSQFEVNLNIVNEPNEFTGYRILSSKKVMQTLNCFAQKCKSDFNDKIKLNKLLFYTDIFHYQKYGVSLNGISYRAIEYGPVPSYYQRILTHAEETGVLESASQALQSGGFKDLFISKKSFDETVFTTQELETLDQIVTKFGNTSSYELYQISHQYKGWIENEKKRGLISYKVFGFESLI